MTATYVSAQSRDWWCASMKCHVNLIEIEPLKKEAKLDFVVNECSAFFSVSMDAPTCKALAAALLQAAADIEKAIWTPTGRKACDACMGLLQDYEQVCERVHGQWVHAPKRGGIKLFICATPPMILLCPE